MGPRRPGDRGVHLFPPMDRARPFHLHHTQTMDPWTEIFATVAELSTAKYTIQQVQPLLSDSFFKGNTPLSLAQAQVWALMWPTVSQSALAKSKSLVCSLLVGPSSQGPTRAGHGGRLLGYNERGVSNVHFGRRAIVSLANPNPLQGTLQADGGACRLTTCPIIRRSIS